MSKYAQFILVIIYAFATITALYILFFLLRSGKLQLDNWTLFTIIAGWLAICFTAVYWYTDLFLLFQRIRKPIPKEEERLLASLYDVQKKANDKKHYRLLVGKTSGLYAFAIGYHTIVVSKDCLKVLTHEELCALLAHEMGHLRTRDCIAGQAFYFANLLPAFIDGFFTIKRRTYESNLHAIIRQCILATLLLLTALIVISSKISVLPYLVPIISFVILLWLFKAVFFFLWLLNSRFTEYRQDEFAHKLGFGPELKKVLLKTIVTGVPSHVDRYSILTRSIHPIIHNRIRRLEKLQGLRDDISKECVATPSPSH
jgi:Zn-dependent protease with chaperone function